MTRSLSVPAIALLLLIWSSSAKAAKNAFVAAGDNGGSAPTLLAQPVPSAQPLATLNVGDPIVISNLPTNGYYKARTVAGQIGWVSINSVSTTPPAGATPDQGSQAPQAQPPAAQGANPAAAPAPASSSDAILDEGLPPPPDETSASPTPTAASASPAPEATAAPAASPSPVAPPQPVATASAAPEVVPSTEAPVATAPMPAPSATAEAPAAAPSPAASPEAAQPPQPAQPAPTPTQTLPYEDVQPTVPEGQPEPAQETEQAEQEEEAGSPPWVLKAFGGIESLNTTLSFSNAGVTMPSTATDLGAELGIPASDRVLVLLRVERVSQSSTQQGYNLSLSTTPLMTGISYSFLKREAKVKLRGALLIGVAFGTELDASAQPPATGSASISTQAFTEMLKLDLEVPVASWLGIYAEGGYRYLDSSSVGPTNSGLSLFPSNVTFPLNFTGFFGCAGVAFYL